MRCRACGAAIEPLVDLGVQPAGSGFPRATDAADRLLPLRLGACVACGLAQLADSSPPESDVADAPSPLSSATMSAHARTFVDDLVARRLTTPPRRILSLASHGGHLVPFLRERDVSATLLEGDDARAKRLSAAGEEVLHGHIDAPNTPADAGVGDFDLIVDSYLLAHLEHPRAAIARMAALLAPGGTLVLEFDSVLATVEGGEWDGVGHGHPVYLSLGWLCSELQAVGLAIVDAVPQPVYGGAVRVFARTGGHVGPSVDALLARERSAGIGGPAGLAPLAEAVDRAHRVVVPYLAAARVAGRRVAGYGAPSRAITFLNALEIGPDLLAFVVDRAPAKQGRTIAGVRIPILAPEALASEQPNDVLVLTWNLVAEVRSALAPLVARGTRLLVAIPGLADVTVDGNGREVAGVGPCVR